MHVWPVRVPGCLIAGLLAAGALIRPPSALLAASSPPRAAAPHGSGPSATVSRQPIVVNAGYSYVDYKTNTIVFKDVVISQGGTRISAENAHANGVGFEDSHWTFEGKVLIDMQPRGTLSADRAVVDFRNERIDQATATGKPARFEQRGTESRRAASGHANEIVYEAAHDSVRLSGDAELTGGPNEVISGPVLLYDIRNERLQAVSPGGERGVHITIAPQSLHKGGEGAPAHRGAPPPAPP
jgi:lipopolysaccharide transport protein LptA